MAKQKMKKSGQYTGVYYRESANRKYKGKPDRTWWVFFQVRKRPRWVEIGKSSAGVTAVYASQRRATLINEAKLGEDIGGQAHTVSHAVGGYLSWMEGKGRDVSRERSRYDLHIAPVLADINLDHLTVGDLDRLKKELRKKPGARSGTTLSNQTVRHVFSLLRRAVNWSIREGHWRGGNPIGPQSRFTMPRVRNEGERFFTPAEAEALLTEVKKRSQPVHDMCFLALSTGLRATEIFGITRQDIDFDSGVIWITAKGGNREKVLVDSFILDMLRAYDREPGELIFQKRGGGRIEKISATFYYAVGALGLNEGITDSRQRVWFHTWRHTFISWCAQSGEYSLLELQQLARHARIEMTMRYAHLIPEDRTPAIDVINRRMKAEAGQGGDHHPGLRLVESQATPPGGPDGTEHTDQRGNKTAPALPTA